MYFGIFSHKQVIQSLLQVDQASMYNSQPCLQHCWCYILSFTLFNVDLKLWHIIIFYYVWIMRYDDVITFIVLFHGFSSSNTMSYALNVNIILPIVWWTVCNGICWCVSRSNRFSFNVLASLNVIFDSF